MTAAFGIKWHDPKHGLAMRGPTTVEVLSQLLGRHRRAKCAQKRAPSTNPENVAKTSAGVSRVASSKLKSLHGSSSRIPQADLGRRSLCNLRLPRRDCKDACKTRAVDGNDQNLPTRLR